MLTLGHVDSLDYNSRVAVEALLLTFAYIFVHILYLEFRRAQCEDRF